MKTAHCDFEPGLS